MRFSMRWPLDHLSAAGLTLASFVLLYVRYWFPPGKIFDEIYFARAAEEYLQRRYIYESTHPPLTKLLITASTMLFGGLHGGDTSSGWRFLDVVFGALMVWMLFVLAKRITGSTLFSAYAAGLLSLDGMHFVQSRIATPESFVGFFSLATVYAFYRYWQASAEAQDRPAGAGLARTRWIAAALALACGALFAVLRFDRKLLPRKRWSHCGPPPDCISPIASLPARDAFPHDTRG
ncbi:MAG: phospholipid carrier-dependent glycosyltransferase [Candidatus Baltobacteraceae bacterium]